VGFKNLLQIQALVSLAARNARPVRKTVVVGLKLLRMLTPAAPVEKTPQRIARALPAKSKLLPATIQAIIERKKAPEGAFFEFRPAPLPSFG